MKKILVVGGAGYVGGVIVDLLLKNKNYEITVYDNLLYEESFRKNCKFIFGDVRDKSFFKNNCNNYSRTRHSRICKEGYTSHGR